MFGRCKHEKSDVVATRGDGPNTVRCRECKKEMLETEIHGIIYANWGEGEILYSDRRKKT